MLLQASGYRIFSIRRSSGTDMRSCCGYVRKDGQMKAEPRPPAVVSAFNISTQTILRMTNGSPIAKYAEGTHLSGDLLVDIKMRVSNLPNLKPDDKTLENLTLGPK